MSPLAEFTASGSPRDVSRLIEAHAAERRLVSALVVPWESDATTLRMAVTAVTGDGWAIEHTNLGTITLADLGGDRTSVAVIAHDGDEQADRDRRAAMLSAFARQIQQRLGSAGPDD